MKIIKMEKSHVKESLLKNSIRLLIGGYLYDTSISDDDDEFDKLVSIPKILRVIASDYENEVENLYKQH